MDNDMKSETVSLDLANILRERIDQCAKFRRHAERPPKELLDAYVNGSDLPEDDVRRVESFLLASCLKMFLNSKEHLIIPDDAKERAASRYIQDVDALGLTFAYQDFYAYQFVDRLDDVVRRAFKVRTVFSKQKPPPEVLPLCREAYQCYLHGFHTASIAAVRAVVEVALKHLLDVDFTGPRDNGLRVLSEEGLRRGLYDRRTKDRIDKLFRETSRVIHAAARGTGPSEHANLQLLGAAQEVLEALVRQAPTRDPQQGRR